MNCSEILREENMDLVPTQQTTHSLLTWCVWSTICLFLFEMVDSYSGVCFQYKMALFKIHISGLICAQHDYISPFVMVYGCLLSIQHNNQEMQGSVNSLSLSPWSVFKGLTEQPQLSLFCLEFPPSWKTQLADCKCYIHQRRLRTMLGGRGCGPPVLLRVQSGGVRGRWRDQRNVRESFRPSHWQSRRTGGSGVSAHCRMTPYCHLRIEGKELLRSRRTWGRYDNIYKSVYCQRFCHTTYTLLSPPLIPLAVLDLCEEYCKSITRTVWWQNYPNKMI